MIRYEIRLLEACLKPSDFARPLVHNTLDISTGCAAELAHVHEHAKPNYDCGARFRPGLGSGHVDRRRRQHFSYDHLLGNRIHSALLFCVAIPQSLAPAAVEP